jgi:hypothetical protein
MFGLPQSALTNERNNLIQSKAVNQFYADSQTPFAPKENFLYNLAKPLIFYSVVMAVLDPIFDYFDRRITANFLETVESDFEAQVHPYFRVKCNIPGCPCEKTNW